jgi:hypothetical protein
VAPSQKLAFLARVIGCILMEWQDIPPNPQTQFADTL